MSLVEKILHTFCMRCTTLSPESAICCSTFSRLGMYPGLFRLVNIYQSQLVLILELQPIMFTYSKTSDDKMHTYKAMVQFSADEKDLKTYILDDMKVLILWEFSGTLLGLCTYNHPKWMLWNAKYLHLVIVLIFIVHKQVCPFILFELFISVITLHTISYNYSYVKRMIWECFYISYLMSTLTFHQLRLTTTSLCYFSAQLSMEHNS